MDRQSSIHSGTTNQHPYQYPGELAGSSSLMQIGSISHPVQPRLHWTFPANQLLSPSFLIQGINAQLSPVVPVSQSIPLLELQTPGEYEPVQAINSVHALCDHAQMLCMTNKVDTSRFARGENTFRHYLLKRVVQDAAPANSELETLLNEFKQFLNIVHLIKDEATKASALISFPPSDISELECIQGTRVRLKSSINTFSLDEAVQKKNGEEQLSKAIPGLPALSQLTNQYIMKELNQKDLFNSVSKSVSVHLPSCGQYLLGADTELLFKSDNFFSSPLPDIPAYMLYEIIQSWPAQATENLKQELTQGQAHEHLKSLEILMTAFLNASKNAQELETGSLLESLNKHPIIHQLFYEKAQVLYNFCELDEETYSRIEKFDWQSFNQHLQKQINNLPFTPETSSTDQSYHDLYFSQETHRWLDNALKSKNEYLFSLGAGFLRILGTEDIPGASPSHFIYLLFQAASQNKTSISDYLIFIKKNNADSEYQSSLLKSVIEAFETLEKVPVYFNMIQSLHLKLKLSAEIMQTLLYDQLPAYQLEDWLLQSDHLKLEGESVTDELLNKIVDHSEKEKICDLLVTHHILDDTAMVSLVENALSNSDKLIHHLVVNHYLMIINLEYDENILQALAIYTLERKLLTPLAFIADALIQNDTNEDNMDHLFNQEDAHTVVTALLRHNFNESALACIDYMAINNLNDQMKNFMKTRNGYNFMKSDSAAIQFSLKLALQHPSLFNRIKSIAIQFTRQSQLLSLSLDSIGRTAQKAGTLSQLLEYMINTQCRTIRQEAIKFKAVSLLSTQFSPFHECNNILTSLPSSVRTDRIKDTEENNLLHLVLLNTRLSSAEKNVLLKKLIQLGCNPNELNFSETPPLMFALRHLETARYLVSAGADMNLKIGNESFYDSVKTNGSAHQFNNLKILMSSN